MTLDQIYSILVAALPSLTAIIGIVTVCVKIIKQFKGLRNEVKATQDIKEVESQLKVVLQENAELKKSMVELNKKVVNKLDHLYISDKEAEAQVNGESK